MGVSSRLKNARQMGLNVEKRFAYADAAAGKPRQPPLLHSKSQPAAQRDQALALLSTARSERSA